MNFFLNRIKIVKLKIYSILKNLSKLTELNLSIEITDKQKNNKQIFVKISNINAYINTRGVTILHF